MNDTHSKIGRMLGVFGDPVAHSKSPAMHQAAMRCLGLPHHYAAFHVRPSQLASALAGAAALDFLGVNLTVPHKHAVLSHLDELDPVAQRIGAVNTVLFAKGRRWGFNTDAPGFVAGWRELNQVVPSRVILLGSGGAARAIVVGICDAFPNVHLDWISRDPVGVECPPGTQDQVRLLAYDAFKQESFAPQDASLWINATSVGLIGGPSSFPVELPTAALTANHTVVDIVYPRPAGGLLDQAQARGAATQDGRAMLLWQGVLALQHWLGESVPQKVVEAMRSVLYP